MKRRQINWVNTPVLMEALIRYEENRLPKSLKLWIEKLLEINTSNNSILLNKTSRF
tara:strand:+ start:4418 stop:4585 length:168 start_codon:yes stop_codon:yes gene_type:complete